MSAERAAARSAQEVARLSRTSVSAAAGYALPFLLVIYLGFSGGGYDTIVLGEVGLAIWWILLVGCIIGLLPVMRITRSGWMLLGILGAFAAWTALAASWSESSERTMAEAGRVASYLGVLALALAVRDSASLRRTVAAVAAAIGVIAIVALVSRLQPSWFPADSSDLILDTGKRLNYPIGYWNGLAALIAIGVPLVLWALDTTRHVVARALIAAAIPLVLVSAYYTLSRGGALAVGVAIVVMFALHPRRTELALAASVPFAGSLIAIAAAAQRPELADGLGGSLADSQANEMIALLLIVAAGVGLVTAAITLNGVHRIWRAPALPRPAPRTTLAVLAVGCLIAAVAFDAPGRVADGWDEFTDPAGPADTSDRFGSASGNGRYQYWSSMVDAASAEPLTGIGPGTFEYWWARNGDRTGFVRDAHSLYFETLGELGIPGLILIAGLIVAVLALGVRGAIAAGDPQRRRLFAAATAACAAFAAAAAIDWVWELPVVVVAFLLLAAGLARRPGPEPAGVPGREPADRADSRSRLLLGALCVAGIIAVVVPLAGSSLVRESQRLAGASPVDALARADAAGDIEPYAAGPKLQQALVLELLGALDGATLAAREATTDEPTNWRTWMVLSRLLARQGDAEGALSAYREARDLNPRSPLFNQEAAVNG